MFDLNFAVDGAEMVPYSATPSLAFKVRVTALERGAVPRVQNVALLCQIRIEPTRRQYHGPEPARLRDLFGKPEDWGRSLRSMLWTHASVMVPPFRGSTVIDLPVPCSYDFNLAATKYFDALEEGEVPLCLLFSGTIFYQAEDGRLQVAQVPWEKEANFRLPVRAWKEMMDHYYPNSAWLGLQKDVFDRLHRFKRERGLTTWDQAIEVLLQAAEAAS